MSETGGLPRGALVPESGAPDRHIQDTAQAPQPVVQGRAVGGTFARYRSLRGWGDVDRIRHVEPVGRATPARA